MQFARKFSEIKKENVDIAGGKGASLGEMSNAGIPVPPGFIILSEAFEKFIQETGLTIEIDAILDSVNTDLPSIRLVTVCIYTLDTVRILLAVLCCVYSISQLVYIYLFTG